MNYKINKKDWHTCKLCNATIKNLAQKYGGNGIYYTKVFDHHLKEDHNILLEDYFGTPPLCKCGICQKTCNISIKGSNFEWRKFACGRYPGTMQWSKRAKKDRQGENNPMYGATPWNKGLTSKDHPSIKLVSQKQSGRKISLATRKKQSESAKKRLVHGHSGCRHSEKSKQKMREATLQRISNGDFKQLKTKPHSEFGKILDSLSINYVEEKQISYWSVDYFLIDFNIYVEIDGDYFHSNPKFYPDGPQTKTQKINFTRDIKKNKYFTTNCLELIRFWECDILNDKESVICKLKKLLESKKLAK